MADRRWSIKRDGSVTWDGAVIGEVSGVNDDWGYILWHSEARISGDTRHGFRKRRSAVNALLLASGVTLSDSAPTILNALEDTTDHE